MTASVSSTVIAKAPRSSLRPSPLLLLADGYLLPASPTLPACLLEPYYFRQIVLHRPSRPTFHMLLSLSSPVALRQEQG